MTTTAAPAGQVLGADDWFDPAGVLLGSRCAGCGSHSFPPRSFCGRCGVGTSRTGLPTTGRLVARSTIRVSPVGFPDRYDVGVVELLPDLHVFARLSSPAPERGDPVRIRVCPVREDEGRPMLGPVFAPAGERPPPPAGRGPASRPALRPTPIRVDLTIAGVAGTAFGRPDRPPATSPRYVPQHLLAQGGRAERAYRPKPFVPM